MVAAARTARASTARASASAGGSARCAPSLVAPPVAAAALAGLELLAGEEGAALLKRLNTHCLEMEQAGFGPVQSAIVPVAMGEAARALSAAEQLLRAGFFVPAIRYPTVPRGRARLRVTLSACHESSRVLALCRELKGLGPLPGDLGD